VAHLGYLLTALADGQLSPATAEKVLEHVTVCRPCAAELAAERRARRMVAEASCGSVPADLAARLRTIAHEPAPTSAPGPLSPLHPQAHPHRRLGALTAVGSLVGASALATALFVAGTPRDVAPAFTDSGALASLGLVAEAPVTAVPASAAAAALFVAGTAPSDLPDGVFTVTAQHRLTSGRGQVLELAGRGGHVVLATQRGRLDAGSVAHLDPARHAGVELYVVAHEPFHAVWQSGDHVVELVTDLPAAQVSELVAHFPAEEYDADLLARLERGWAAVTGGMRR